MRCTCPCNGQPIPSSKFALDDDPQVCKREKAGRERKGGGREGGIHRDTETEDRERKMRVRESARARVGGGQEEKEMPREIGTHK